MSPPNGSMILIMVCFWVTLWLVSRYLIGPIDAALAERGEKLDGAEKTWTAQRADMDAATRGVEEELLEAARVAAKNREAHRAKALEAKQAKLEAVRTEAEQRLAEAVAGLSRDADAAEAELRSQAESLARTFTERLLGREVTP